MSGYIGTQPVPQSTQTRDSFTATASQTSFATSGYTPLYLDVFLNGVKLAAADYTATNGSDVVLTTGAALSDILEVVAYSAFDTANVTGATDFTVTGAFTSQGIDDNANATAMTIDSSENVQFGTTQTFPAFNNVVGCEVGGFGQISASRDGAEAMQLNRKSSDGDIALFKKDGTTVGSIGSGNSGLGMYISAPNNGGAGLFFNDTASVIYPTKNVSGTNTLTDDHVTLGAQTLRFKDLYLSGGVYLGGTGAANKLDDYEEGTFTPTVVFGSGSAGITYNTRDGKYTKIGNTVQYYIQCGLSSKGSSIGNLSITGLPFTNTDTASPPSVLTGSFTNTSDVQIYLNTGGATLNFENRNTGTQTPLSNSNVNNNSTMFIAGVYRTSQ